MFGGFLFYKNADELELLSNLTNIPKDNVLDCISFFDDFFTNFFMKNKYDMMLMKGVPAIIRGGGCFFRQNAFQLKEYSDKYGDASWLLSKWHNAAYYALEPHLKQYAKK